MNIMISEGNKLGVEVSALQNKEYEILCDFKRLCDRYNLKYYLSDGTLLGAVRHKGFIPWDDDIDVAMPYSDYCLFLNVAQQELGEKYFVQNQETEINFPSPFTKIRLNTSVFLDSSFMDWHINHGVWIDIFPIVRTTTHRYKIVKIILKFCKILQMDDLIDSNRKAFFDIYGIKIHALKAFYKIFPLKMRQEIHKKLLKLICNHKRGDKCFEMYGSNSKLFPCDLFIGSMELEFNGGMFSVPPQYSKYLEISYGDYMTLPPVEKRVTHHSSKAYWRED